MIAAALLLASIIIVGGFLYFRTHDAVNLSCEEWRALMRDMVSEAGEDPEDFQMINPPRPDNCRDWRIPAG
ncbi:MAG: hypothetical protein QOH26_563 [Actinomycetota bacterium]|jgi:hypothetical protein|nr:hypothetical protein [Actinomycetota bacterium]